MLTASKYNWTDCRGLTSTSFVVLNPTDQLYIMIFCPSTALIILSFSSLAEEIIDRSCRAIWRAVPNSFKLNWHLVQVLWNPLFIIFLLKSISLSNSSYHSSSVNFLSSSQLFWSSWSAANLTPSLLPAMIPLLCELSSHYNCVQSFILWSPAWKLYFYGFPV